jgi:hypothetical protein
MSIPRLILGIVVACAAVTAAIVLNLVLLGAASAQNDSVGNLSSRAKLPPAPTWTIRPTTSPAEHDRADD